MVGETVLGIVDSANRWVSTQTSSLEKLVAGHALFYWYGGELRPRLTDKRAAASMPFPNGLCEAQVTASIGGNMRSPAGYFDNWLF